ncbi:hypothetical protein EJ419_03115 [Alloscardovia theropitheci]|uniref:Uncharacterized protein n=1 Tax=Alloscardovia theropitheci TaxID=2496842 RepID=A0A4R0QXT7_9BIFI|nr:hypothetical protein [Alloscardovia theropitheci]TCD54480.1 hypothetical protein EJ419_03115 [Alloscardovia theropitheci]
MEKVIFTIHSKNIRKVLVVIFVGLLTLLPLSCGSREADFRDLHIDDYAVAVSLSPSTRELATSGYVFLISHDGKYRIVNTGVLRGLQTVWNHKGLFIPAADSNYAFLHNGELSFSRDKRFTMMIIFFILRYQMKMKILYSFTI